jgi:hypothetical protein
MFQQQLHTVRAHRDLYLIASFRGEAMRRQLDWLDKNSEEHWALNLQGSTLAAAGQLRQAQSLARRAVNLAAQRDLKELAATFAVWRIVDEASCGLCQQAKQEVAAALALSRACHTLLDYPVLPSATFALALCGAAGEAQQLVDEMKRRYPRAPLLNALYLPTISAAIELQRGRPARAVQLLEAATPYERAGLFLPTYLRGQAYLRLRQGAAAAAEFQKIRDHFGWGLNSTLYPLAALGLARAAALSGDVAQARKAYQDFLAAWKEADAELPVLLEARKEYEQVK